MFEFKSGNIVRTLPPAYEGKTFTIKNGGNGHIIIQQVGELTIELPRRQDGTPSSYISPKRKSRV